MKYYRKNFVRIARVMIMILVITSMHFVPYIVGSQTGGIAFADVADSVLDTGLYKTDGQWKYYENGEFKAITGIVPRASDGKLFYVEDGIFKKATGMAKSRTDKKWYYIEKGAYKEYTGLAKSLENGKYYYINKGIYDNTYTGLAKSKSNYYYVKNGKLDRTYTGLAKSKSNYYYVKNGKLDRSYTGLAKSDSNYYYVKEGKLDKTYTGLAKSTANYYYVKNGKLDKSYTGLAKSTSNYYYVDKGKLNKKFTGIVKSTAKYYYVQDGKLNRKYSGGVTYDGIDWIVQQGKATKVSSQSDRTLFRAMKLVESITDDNMTKQQKLKACFEHIRDKYREYNPRIPHYRGNNWWWIYANDIFVDNGGNCLSCGAAFAYLAKAIGYEDVYACNTGGHGWAEVDGLVYDPEWARHKHDHSYFGVPYNAGYGPGYKIIFSMGGYSRVKI